MVKVLRIEPDKSVSKEIICRGCGATLSYVKNDVREYHGTDYGGGPDGREWIICPNCGNDVTIRSW
jgi:ribosomal protein S27AE